MALTLPPNGHHAPSAQGEERLGRHSSYGKVSIHDSNAHLGDFYHIEHYHYYYPGAESSGSISRRENISKDPEAVSERSTDLPTPVTEQEGWVSTLKNISCNAFVWLQDEDRDDKAAQNTDAACEIKIEVQGEDLITNSRRSLGIIWRNPDRTPEYFWLPGTYMKVARSGKSVEMEFSDCKQKANATKDYVNNYTAVYKPAKPNVSISFDCQDERLASELQARLLHYKGPSAPDQGREATFPQHCTVRHDSVQTIDGKTLGRGLFVWSHITDSDTRQECNVLDLGCFTSQLDFEIDVVDNTFILYLRHFMKIRYVPIDVGKNAYWPPRKVEDNKSGAPASMEIAVDPKDDALVMKAPLDQSVNLLGSTIGHECGTTAHAWFNLDYVENFRKIGRSRQAQGQLSLWDKEGYLYGLLRKMNTDENNHTDDEEPPKQLWRTVRWKEDKSRPPVKVADQKIIIEDIESMTGDYLSRNDKTVLEPRMRDPDAKNSSEWEKTKIELRFRSREDVDRFTAVIREYNIE